MLLLIIKTIMVWIGLFLIFSTIMHTILLRKDFKYYKSVYKSLPFRTFVRINDIVTVYDSVTKQYGNFSWFIIKNNFILDGGFLHNRSYTWFSPYSLYWLIKYQKWCKKNINLLTIKTYITNETIGLRN